MAAFTFNLPQLNLTFATKFSKFEYLFLPQFEGTLWGMHSNIPVHIYPQKNAHCRYIKRKAKTIRDLFRISNALANGMHVSSVFLCMSPCSVCVFGLIRKSATAFIVAKYYNSVLYVDKWFQFSIKNIQLSGAALEHLIDICKIDFFCPVTENNHHGDRWVLLIVFAGNLWYYEHSRFGHQAALFIFFFKFSGKFIEKFIFLLNVSFLPPSCRFTVVPTTAFCHTSHRESSANSYFRNFNLIDQFRNLVAPFSPFALMVHSARS